MRIVHKDLSKGEIKLKIETIEDLWHLSQIIGEGDVVFDVTYRRQQSKADMVRSNKTEKIRVFLGVRIEKIEFSHYSDTLRLTGVIVEGDQVGSYHTLNIEVLSKPKIVKQWKQYQLDRITDAVRSAKDPKILIIAMDEGEADFGFVKQYGIDFPVSIYRNIPGKRDPSSRQAEKDAFFREVAEKMDSYFSEMPLGVAIVAGPGFAKEEFHSWVSQYKPNLIPKIAIKSVSVTGKTGVWEVVKRGYVETIYEESRVAKEITLLEDFFRKILSDEAVYGIREVRDAVNNSQAAHVIVTDELLRTSEEVQSLVQLAKSFRSTPHIISTSHEGGEKLRGMGGIGAVLRFRLSY